MFVAKPIGHAGAHDSRNGIQVFQGNGRNVFSIPRGLGPIDESRSHGKGIEGLRHADTLHELHATPRSLDTSPLVGAATFVFAEATHRIEEGC